MRIQCGRETEARLQIRLFGDEASSFMTGAFERAKGGAILLEDVDALTPALQDALTNYLAMERPAGGRSRSVEVQILTASQVPLINRVLAGAFRDELYPS